MNGFIVLELKWEIIHIISGYFTLILAAVSSPRTIRIMLPKETKQTRMKSQDVLKNFISSLPYSTDAQALPKIDCKALQPLKIIWFIYCSKIFIFIQSKLLFEVDMWSYVQNTLQSTSNITQYEWFNSFFTF